MRDAETGDYWSATWQPTRGSLDAFEARHGAGFTKVFASQRGIESNLTYYVPPRDDVEVWMVSLKNTSDKRRVIQAFPFVKWDLANYSYNAVEASFSALFNESSVEDNIIYASTRFWNITSGAAGNPNADGTSGHS